MSFEAQSIKIGSWYTHYKGTLYRVISVARHSETLQEMVVYQRVGSGIESVDLQIWVRPLDLFLEQVMVDGKSVPRFKLF